MMRHDEDWPDGSGAQRVRLALFAAVGVMLAMVMVGIYVLVTR
jgi:hypothetical protein